MQPTYSLPNFKERPASTGKHRAYKDVSYTKLELLGRGRARVCWKAQFDNGVKAVLKQVFSKQDFKELAHYLNVLSTLKGHPAIAVTESTFWTVNKKLGNYKFFQIQTYYPHNLLDAVNEGLFHNNQQLVLIAFKQLAAGLHYIHSKGVVVNDIKLENIFFTHSLREGTQFVFGDLDGADLANERSTLDIGSYHYLSPERLAKKPRRASDDVYALGICFLAIQKEDQLFTFPITLRDKMHIHIFDATSLIINSIVQPQFLDLIRSMVMHVCDYRLTARQVLDEVNKLKPIMQSSSKRRTHQRQHSL